jgi:hypothetical protein
MLNTKYIRILVFIFQIEGISEAISQEEKAVLVWTTYLYWNGVVK